MYWIKWKLSQLKKWILYFIMYRAQWKKIGNSESDKGYWEIWNISENGKITLHYVPREDYSKEDVKIEVPYEQFEDLVKFMINIR